MISASHLSYLHQSGIIHLTFITMELSQRDQCFSSVLISSQWHPNMISASHPAYLYHSGIILTWSVLLIHLLSQWHYPNMISACHASYLYHRSIIPTWSVLFIHLIFYLSGIPTLSALVVHLIFITVSLTQHDHCFSSILSVSQWHYTNMISAFHPAYLYHSDIILTW